MNESVVVVGGILGLVGFVISLICVSMIAGFLRSTHTVQYMPYENKPEDLNAPDVAAENEKILLGKVGRKLKDKPTVIEEIDLPLENISKSEINF